MIKVFFAYFELICGYILLLPHIIFFLLSSQTLRKVVYEDMNAINQKMHVKMKGLNVLVYVLFRNPFYRKLFYHRLGALSFLFSWYYPGSPTFYPTCKDIKGGVLLAHPVATFLNAKSIGNGFVCRQNVTIGNKNEEQPQSKPTIGNNVSVGANVCIIGDIRIGNNVTIGAGSVVVSDIPDNCVVVGNPARIIKRS